MSDSTQFEVTMETNDTQVIFNLKGASPETPALLGAFLAQGLDMLENLMSEPTDAVSD